MKAKAPSYRPEIETLECRLLLHAVDASALIHPDPALAVFPAPDSAELQPRGYPVTRSSVPAQADTNSLSSVPALNSFPGARVSLYLDFDGNIERRWGGYVHWRRRSEWRRARSTRGDVWAGLIRSWLIRRNLLCQLRCAG